MPPCIRGRSSTAASTSACSATPRYDMAPLDDDSEERHHVGLRQRRQPRQPDPAVHDAVRGR